MMSSMYLTTSLLVLAAVLPGQAPGQDFTHNFRGGNPLPERMQLTGHDDLVEVTPEEEGLRIKIAANRGKDGAGVETRFPISGDFEITASYEILSADRPGVGYGVGVNLSISPADWKSKRASLGRFWKVQNGSGFSALFMSRAQEANKAAWEPTETLKGQLRLRRAGAKLVYLVNVDLGQPFREICQVEYGTDNIDMFRFVANPGNSPAAVDVRLLDLQMHWGGLPAHDAPVPAAGVPAVANAGVGPAREQRPRNLWWLALLCAFLLGAGALTVYLVQQRKKKATTA